MPRLNQQRLTALLEKIEEELYLAWVETKNNLVSDILEKVRNRLLLIIQTLNYVEHLNSQPEIEYSGDESCTEDSY
jgi:hypothetical protein